MFYEYAELSDGTQIAYSNVLKDDTVEVSIERPVELGFNSEEVTVLDAFVHRNAPLILRLAREVSRTYA